MALRSEELPNRLQSLSGLLTSHEAASYLQMTYWHFMHLVEAGRISGMRVVDRWLFSTDDLDAYRRERYGEMEDAARTALESPDVTLTQKQEAICRRILAGRKPSEIARELKQSRQAVHAQLGLIRDKVDPTRQTSPQKAPPSPSCDSAATASHSSWRSPVPTSR
jgi:excisionase family DNA binding protein